MARRLNTRLTKRFGIEHPIIQAPMAKTSGGALAGAVSDAGGLGLIGGGYGDADWLDAQYAIACNRPVGCGFITWSLAKQPDLLTRVLERSPRAVFLSFGDPAPFARKIQEAGVPLICQVQTLCDAMHAANCGADVIVAQGSEAGGHGEKRATFTLVSEVADWVYGDFPDTLVCAAGGIADGRGLAAALALGADGVVVGSRFWASAEALVADAMQEAAILATGDDTIRSTVMDIARKLDWPERYSARVLRNAFTDRWHNDIPGLLAVAETESARWNAAMDRGDPTIANTFVGEATGLIEAIHPAGKIVETLVREAIEEIDRVSRVVT
ncbi:MAG: nitronate monooxygenase [Pseudomonadota bacterium]